ncbi:hypothetical protein [Cysteiniphilum litorale]|uniref:hypothetical protein n=1 Tax=Cysteiniphilum litorale TaxID=2056700 RepID=UPI003F884A82
MKCYSCGNISRTTHRCSFCGGNLWQVPEASSSSKVSGGREFCIPDPQRPQSLFHQNLMQQRSCSPAASRYHSGGYSAGSAHSYEQHHRVVDRRAQTPSLRCFREDSAADKIKRGMRATENLATAAKMVQTTGNAVRGGYNARYQGDQVPSHSKGWGELNAGTFALGSVGLVRTMGNAVATIVDDEASTKSRCVAASQAALGAAENTLTIIARSTTSAASHATTLAGGVVGAVGGVVSAADDVSKIISYCEKIDDTYIALYMVNKYFERFLRYGVRGAVDEGQLISIASLKGMLSWLLVKYENACDRRKVSLANNSVQACLGVISTIAFAAGSAATVGALMVVGAAFGLCYLGYAGYQKYSHYQSNRERFAEYREMVQYAFERNDITERQYREEMQLMSLAKRHSSEQHHYFGRTFGDYMRTKIAAFTLETHSRRYNEIDPFDGYNGRMILYMYKKISQLIGFNPQRHANYYRLINHKLNGHVVRDYEINSAFDHDVINLSLKIDK